MYFKTLFSVMACFSLSLCAASDESKKTAEGKVAPVTSSETVAKEVVAAIVSSNPSFVSVYQDWPGHCVSTWTSPERSPSPSSHSSDGLRDFFAPCRGN